MKQPQTIDAMNHFIRTVSINSSNASKCRDSWIAWYDDLGWHEKTMTPEVLREGLERCKAFVQENGGSDFGAESTIRQGSKGASVAKWQKIIGVNADGNFGPGTKAATIVWQRSHGLSADGVVGPASWAKTNESQELTQADRERIMGLVGLSTMQSYEDSRDATQKSDLAAKFKAGDTRSPPPPSKVVAHPTIRMGSRGDAVKEWQKLLGLVPTGIFDRTELSATKGFQSGHRLTPDGIVGPRTWMAAYASSTIINNTPLPGAVVDASGLLPPALAPTTSQVVRMASIRVPSVITKPVGQPVAQSKVASVLRAAPRSPAKKEEVLRSELTSGAPTPPLAEAGMFSMSPSNWNMGQKIGAGLGLLATVFFGAKAIHKDGSKKVREYYK